MAEKSEDTKLSSADEQAASAEPKLAKDESTKADTSTDQPSAKEKASAAASSAASTAASGAAGVKDNVFSMFGGGAKKEKKEDDDEAGKDEPSGSSKAKKDDEEVSGSSYTTMDRLVEKLVPVQAGSCISSANLFENRTPKFTFRDCTCGLDSFRCANSFIAYMISFDPPGMVGDYR